jgi:hypothetical protein
VRVGGASVGVLSRVVVQPLVRAAIAVAALAVVSGVVTERSERSMAAPSRAEVAGAADAPMRMPCGARELPEGGACVPIPRLEPSALAGVRDAEPPGADPSGAAGADGPPGAALDRGAAEAGGSEDEASEVAGVGDGGDQRIPRRPDRPADVMTLQLPLGAEPRLLAPAGVPLTGDADLSVLRLVAPVGTPVVAPGLRGQEGDVEVLAVERLVGRGLVVAALATTREPSGAAAGKLARGATRAGSAPRQPAGSAREAGAERWLLLFGSLEGAGPGLAKGSRLAPGAVVGFVGDALTGEPHVRFEVRRVRAGVDPLATPVARLVGDAETIAVDARNVLAPR